MIASLMRRDPIRRPPWAWLLLILIGLQFTLVMRGSATWAASRTVGAPAGFLLSLLAIWVPLALYQFAAGHTARGSRLDLGLPVPGRALWTAHLLVYLGAGLVIATACALLEAAGAAVLAHMRVHPVPPSQSLRLLPHAVGWFAVTAVLTNGRRRDLLHPVAPGALSAAGGSGASSAPSGSAGPSASWVYFGQSLGLQLAGFALLWWLGRWPPVFAIVPLLAAAGLAVLLARGVPPALSEIAREPGAQVETQAAGPAAARRLLRLRTLWLTLFGPLLPWVHFVPVLIFGWLCSGNLQDLDGSPDNRGVFACLAAVVFLTAVIAALRRLPMLDALPISRRAIFPVLVLPSILAFAIGYGVGRAGSALLADQRERIVFAADHEGQYHLRVPLHDFEIAWSGRPPTATSPWGESHSPLTFPIQPGLSPVLYKPFTTPSGSSLDFVALQISRAMQAVYGTSLLPEVIRERYLALDDGGRVAASAGGLTLRADDPRLSVPGYGPVLAIMLVITGVPYFLLLAGALRALRRRCDEVARRTVLWVALVVVVGLQLLYLAGAIADWWDPDIHWAAVRVLVRHGSADVPGGAVLIWIVGLAILWAAYKVAERQFTKLEAPARPDTSYRWWLTGGGQER